MPIQNQLTIIDQYMTNKQFIFAQEELKRLCASEAFQEISSKEINELIQLTDDLAQWLLQQGAAHYETADQICELASQAFVGTNILTDVLARFYYTVGDHYCEYDLLELALFKYYQALDTIEHTEQSKVEQSTLSEVLVRINRLEIIGRYHAVKLLMDQCDFKEVALDKFNWIPLEIMGNAFLSVNDKARLDKLYKKPLDAFQKCLDLQLHHNYQSIFSEQEKRSQAEKYQYSVDKFTHLYGLIKDLLPIFQRHQQYENIRSLYYLFDTTIKKYKEKGIDSVSSIEKDIDETITQLNQCIFQAPEQHDVPAYQPVWFNARKQLHASREKLRRAQPSDDIVLMQQEFTKEIQEQLAELIKQCILVLGEPPCAFNLMGVGSIGYGLSPYSDVDCALLIAEKNYRDHPYFNALIHLFNFHLNLFGEFQLNIFGRIRCIRSGLHLDSGDLTMFQTKDLIDTPEGFVEKYHPIDTENVDAAQPELYAILTPVVIYTSVGGENLLCRYLECLDKTMQWLTYDEKNPKTLPYHQQLGRLYHNAHCEQYEKEKEKWDKDSQRSVDIKARYLAPMIFFIKDLALFLGIQAISIYQLFETFESLGLEIIAKLKPLYSEMIAIRFGLHLQTNMHNDIYRKSDITSYSAPFHLFEPLLLGWLPFLFENKKNVAVKLFNGYELLPFFSLTYPYQANEHIKNILLKLHETLERLVNLDESTAIACILDTFPHLNLHNYKNPDNITFLHQAAFLGNVKTVKLLLQRNACVDIRGGEYHETPVHQAAKRGYVAIVKLFLEPPINMNINVKAGGDWTLLHKATRAGHLKPIRYLLTQGADINAKCFPRQGTNKGEGWTALHLATFFARTKIIYTLVQEKADLMARCDLITQDKKTIISGCTALHLAVYHGGHEPLPDLEVIKILLTLGIEQNAKTKEGETALHLAVRSGAEDVVKTLLELDVNTEVRNEKGETPLFYAATSRNETMIALLMKYGANVRARKNNGNFTIGCPGIHDTRLDTWRAISRYADEQFGEQAANSIRKTRKLEQRLNHMQQENDALQKHVADLENIVKELQCTVQQLIVPLDKKTVVTDAEQPSPTSSRFFSPQ